MLSAAGPVTRIRSRSSTADAPVRSAATTASRLSSAGRDCGSAYRRTAAAATRRRPAGTSSRGRRAFGTTRYSRPVPRCRRCAGAGRAGRATSARYCVRSCRRRPAVSAAGAVLTGLMLWLSRTVAPEERRYARKVRASGVTSALYQNIAANAGDDRGAGGQPDAASRSRRKRHSPYDEEAQVGDGAEQPVREEQLPQLAVAADGEVAAALAARALADRDRVAAADGVAGGAVADQRATRPSRRRPARSVYMRTPLDLPSSSAGRDHVAERGGGDARPRATTAGDADEASAANRPRSASRTATYSAITPSPIHRPRLSE